MVRMLRRRDLSSPLSEFLGITVVVAVLYFGGRLVLQDNIGLAPENFIGFILIFSQLISPAKSFSNAFYHIQRGLASVERIEQVLDAPVTIQDHPDARPVKEFKEHIKFEDVSFSYNKDEIVLENINLTFPKGKTCAIVGPSGAGKSTLVDLIPRFYDPDEGQITLDGTDIRNYKIEDLRQLIGIVTQESILFNDTIYNNITFGVEEASQEDVEQAAKVANAHRFIVKFSDGYQTNIGDQGSKLSGGQRQRITIARAILKNPPILILDEATSSLDTKSEQLVQEALSQLMKNRTSIVIAHRLSTIQDADRIVVLEEGQITEKGVHPTLMEKGGAYKKLVELQTFES
jgi:subfamily B ATP-binding cassette protein MsbA